MDLLSHRVILMLALVTLINGYCLHEKIQRLGNCSFRYQCHGNIRASLPQECQEASNDPVTVDVTLTDAIERFDYKIDEYFLSFITSLRISGVWPRTKLSLLEYTTRIEKLYLSGNQIEMTGGKPFFRLNTLEVLDLSHNRLSNIDKLLQFEYQPNKLSELSLASNRIEDIPADAFEELTYLIKLDLSNNLISDLTAEPFSNLTNLEVLKLSNNKIKNLNGAVNNLHNLKHLYLRGNQIENIDVESLDIIIHLETFDVSWNQLEEIKPILLSRHWKHLNGHPICKIIISDNKITSLFNGSLKEEWETEKRLARHVRGRSAVDVLTELDLSNNDIDYIEYNAFRPVKLISLDLSKNKITGFVVNADDIAYVQYLNLSSNYIRHLVYESFSNMNSLQNLDLSHNQLNYIPDKTFLHNYNLRYVNMTFNAFETLNSLHIDMFHPKGGVVDLSNNGLTRLRITPGEGRRLATLVLHSNNITDPSLVDLRYQSDLKNLDMSHNKIEELSENSLLLPVGLNDLDLSCNRIRNISPSTFISIGHLKTLHLAHNQLKSLEYGTFRGLTALLNLDLSYNNLGTVDSKYFMDLKSLAVLSLRHNGMKLLKDEAWYSHKFNLKVYLEGNYITCEWLARALNNNNNGYSKMRPTVLEGTISGHTLEGVPCVPEDNKSARFLDSGSDERLLITTQKILEAVREQTFYLKKFIWRSLQEDADKARV